MTAGILSRDFLGERIMSFKKSEAVIRNGKMYTLRVFRHPMGWPSPTKWIGFRDGQKFGYFKTKAAFLRAVEDDQYAKPQDFALPAIIAEGISTVEGTRMLRSLLNRLDDRSEEADFQEG